jgi:type IV secretion system protein VirB10
VTDRSPPPATGDERDPGAPVPLAGEPGIPDVAQPSRPRVSRKALVALAVFVLSLIAVSAISIQRFVGSKKPDDMETKRNSDRPAAASTDPKRLDLTLRSATVPSQAASVAPRIPAIMPTEDELAEPIGVRRTAQAQGTGPKAVPPEDAPAVLVSSRPGSSAIASLRNTGSTESNDVPPGSTPLEQTRRDLDAYRRQLQGVLESLSRSAQAPSTALPGGLLSAAPLEGARLSGIAAPTGGTSQGGLFGGQLQGSSTPRVVAGMLSHRSLVLPKGTTFTCALKTKVVSATSGLIGCQVQRNVYGHDGRVLLMERGSHIDGEYRIASVRPGTVRIPVLWTRIRTPHGVVVDIDSPGTGPLGESGIEGYVDNRWGERIGAALLLSVIDDAVKLAITHETSSAQGDNTVVLQSTTANTSKLAEKVLDSTINIPPLIYQNQGGVVGIHVARDVDFSSVYELQPVPR